MSYIRNNLLIGTAMPLLAVKSETGTKAVKANVYRDAAGKVLPANDHDAIASAYRDAAKVMLDDGEELAELSVAQVYAIVSAIPGDGKAADMARATAVYEYEPKEVLPDLSETTETLAQRIAVYSGSAKAYEIGSKLDTATLDHFSALADAKEDFDGAPLIVAGDFERQFSVTEITSWPVPGGRHDKPPFSTRMTNAQPDYYKVTDNAGKDVKGSVYHDMFLSTALGKSYDRARALVKLTEGPMLPADADELEKYLAPIKRTAKQLADDVHNRTSAKKWLDNRINAIVGKMRRAVAYIQQRERVNAIPNMRVHMLDDDVSVAAKKRDPLVMEYRPDVNKRPDLSDNISVGTFIKYDIAKAKAAAEQAGVPITIAHITATTKRVGKKGQGKTTTAARTLATNIHEWTDAVYSVVGFGQQKDKFAAILEACDKDPELLEAVGDCIEMLDGVGPKIDIRYRNIKANKSSLRDHMAQTEKKVA